MKITIVAILIAITCTPDKLCNHSGFGHEKIHVETGISENRKEIISPQNITARDHYVNDTIYQWDEKLFDWVVSEETNHLNVFNDSSSFNQLLSEPIEVDWKTLMDIQYKLKYYAEFEMDLFAPVFSEAVKALHGKEVIIEGFTIPFEEEGILSLSYYPFAACFFCGKASPASIISLYLNQGNKRYKIDDYKKFKGILYLNRDDPNEFYYILREAEEEKV